MYFRPSSFGELMDSVFRILRKAFWPIWLMLFLFNTPVELFFLIWAFFFEDTSGGAEPILLGIHWFVSFIFLFPPFQNICTNVVLHQLKNEEQQLTPKDLFIISFNRLGQLFVVNGLITLTLVILAMLILFVTGLPMFFFISVTDWVDHLKLLAIVVMLIGIFPASYIWIRLFLVFPIIIVEKKGIREALMRSWVLTQRSYLSILSKWIILGFFQAFIIFLCFMLADSFQHVSLFYHVVLLIIDPIFLAWSPILLSLIYFDQRTKKEAYDLQLSLEKSGEG